MVIRAVVFDIGGVLEITPDLGTGRQPGEMVFLDDADRCVAGAREAGLRAVRYRDNAQAIAEIEDLLTAR